MTYCKKYYSHLLVLVYKYIIYMCYVLVYKYIIYFRVIAKRFLIAPADILDSLRHTLHPMYKI